MMAYDEVAAALDGLCHDGFGGVEAYHHACHLAVAVGQADLQPAVVPLLLYGKRGEAVEDFKYRA